MVDKVDMAEQFKRDYETVYKFVMWFDLLLVLRLFCRNIEIVIRILLYTCVHLLASFPNRRREDHQKDVGDLHQFCICW